MIRTVLPAVKSSTLLRQIVAGEVPSRRRSAELIGIRMTTSEEGRVTFELDAGPQHASPLGTLHGGILCDLADAAMGCAYVSLLAEGETFTTLELKINFLKPVWAGAAHGRGRCEARRTISLGECRVTDESGASSPTPTSTCMTLRGEAARGR